MHRRLHKKNGIFSITKDTMSALLNLLKARQRKNTENWTTSYSTTITGKQLLWRFCGIQLQSGSSTFSKISRWTIIKPILVPTLKQTKTTCHWISVSCFSRQYVPLYQFQFYPLFYCKSTHTHSMHILTVKLACFCFYSQLHNKILWTYKISTFLHR